MPFEETVDEILVQHDEDEDIELLEVLFIIFPLTN